MLLEWAKVLLPAILAFFGALLGAKKVREGQLKAERESSAVELSENKKDELAKWMVKLLSYPHEKFLDKQVQLEIFLNQPTVSNYPELGSTLLQFLANQISINQGNIFNGAEATDRTLVERKKGLIEDETALRKIIQKYVDEFIRKV